MEVPNVAKPPQPPAGWGPNGVVTTEDIQKLLDENRLLILAIHENQNLGKVNDCASYQSQLQKNLIFLATIADKQPGMRRSHAHTPQENGSTSSVGVTPPPHPPYHPMSSVSPEALAVSQRSVPPHMMSTHGVSSAVPYQPPSSVPFRDHRFQPPSSTAMVGNYPPTSSSSDVYSSNHNYLPPTTTPYGRSTTPGQPTNMPQPSSHPYPQSSSSVDMMKGMIPQQHPHQPTLQMPTSRTSTAVTSSSIPGQPTPHLLPPESTPSSSSTTAEGFVMPLAAGGMSASERDAENRSKFWTREEHSRFLEAINRFGPKDVKKITEHVQTRTHTQVRSHLQKYLNKVDKLRQEAAIQRDEAALQQQQQQQQQLSSGGASQPMYPSIPSSMYQQKLEQYQTNLPSSQPQYSHPHSHPHAHAGHAPPSSSQSMVQQQQQSQQQHRLPPQLQQPPYSQSQPPSAAAYAQPTQFQQQQQRSTSQPQMHMMQQTQPQPQQPQPQSQPKDDLAAKQARDRLVQQQYHLLQQRQQAMVMQRQREQVPSPHQPQPQPPPHVQQPQPQPQPTQQHVPRQQPHMQQLPNSTPQVGDASLPYTNAMQQKQQAAIREMLQGHPPPVPYRLGASSPIGSGIGLGRAGAAAHSSSGGGSSAAVAPQAAVTTTTTATATGHGMTPASFMTPSGVGGVGTSMGMGQAAAQGSGGVVQQQQQHLQTAALSAPKPPAAVLPSVGPHAGMKPPYSTLPAPPSVHHQLMNGMPAASGVGGGIVKLPNTAIGATTTAAGTPTISPPPSHTHHTPTYTPTHTPPLPSQTTTTTTPPTSITNPRAMLPPGVVGGSMPSMNGSGISRGIGMSTSPPPSSQQQPQHTLPTPPTSATTTMSLQPPTATASSLYTFQM